MDRTTKTVYSLSALAVVFALIAWVLLSTTRTRHNPNPDGSRRPAQLTNTVGATSVDIPQLNRETSDRILSEPTSSVALTLEIVDAEGRPISGAHCSIVLEESFAEIGVTNEAGHLSTRISTDMTGEIIAHAPGFANTAASFRSDNNDVELKLIMPPGGYISGTVTTPSGGLISECRVFAFRATTVINPETVSKILVGDPRVQTAVAESSGFFQVEGLNPNYEYSLLAAGSGYLTRNRVPPILPSASGIELPLFPLYGVILSLVDPHGGAISANSDLISFPTGNLTSNDHSVLYLDPNDFMAQLAGIHVDQLDLGDGNQQLFLFSAEDDKAEVGPITHLIRVPGYDPVITEVMVPRLSSSVPVQNLELIPNASDRGKLNLAFQGVERDPSFGNPRSVLPVGTLFLQRENEEVYQILFWHFPHEAKLIEDIPYGHYKAWFTTANRFYRLPQFSENTFPVLIGETTAQLTIPAQELGSIQLKFPAGMDSYSGDVDSVRCQVKPLQWLGSHNSGLQMSAFPIVFNSPPFLIEGLPPGRYQIELNQPFRRTIGNVGDEIYVTSGETTILEVQAE